MQASSHTQGHTTLSDLDSSVSSEHFTTEGSLAACDWTLTECAKTACMVGHCPTVATTNPTTGREARDGCGLNRASVDYLRHCVHVLLLGWDCLRHCVHVLLLGWDMPEIV